MCVHGCCCGAKSRVTGWQHPSLSPSGPRLLWWRGYQHQMPSAVVLLCCCCAVGWTTYMLLLMRLFTAPRARGVQVWRCTLDHIISTQVITQTHFYVQNIEIYHMYDLDIFSLFLTSTTYILQILAEFLQILQKLVAQ